MKKILLESKEYFDNSCKGEDLWGIYKTANGVLYVVIDGASSHEGTKTGADVAQLIDETLKKEAKNIVHRADMKDLVHSINDESTKVNEGAYAAIAGILHRGKQLYGFSAGDVSIIAKKASGKLLQVLPLDLSMDWEEAERLAKAEIGTVVNNIEITEFNYELRIRQYTNHALCNAIGVGEDFFLNTMIFETKHDTALLLASDGVTDPFMKSQRAAGEIKKANAEKLYEFFSNSHHAEDAVTALEDLIWNTQVEERKKIKPDDRTALFLYMNYAEMEMEQDNDREDITDFVKENENTLELDDKGSEIEDTLELGSKIEDTLELDSKDQNDKPS